MRLKKKPFNRVAQNPVFVLNVLNMGSQEEPRVLLSGLFEVGFIVITEFWGYLLAYLKVAQLKMHSQREGEKKGNGEKKNRGKKYEHIPTIMLKELPFL